MAFASVNCYVLEDGTRVFSQRGLQDGLAMGVRGGALRMAKFADDIALRARKSKDLTARFKNPIKFMSPRGMALGHEATILVDLCDAILEARSDRLADQDDHRAWVLAFLCQDSCHNCTRSEANRLSSE